MANKPITLEEMKAYVDATWEKCQTEAWHGLTDDEICPWFQENTALTNEAAMRITRAIEAKLKEKNT
jgi:hypothetical protein